ncbi:MAG TPA: Fic family protein, partial [Phycisphaerales bacterium]|nr:Fic family protein [Phycisphaerales bacterium]
MDVIFLTTEDVLRIHENQISLYGGEATVRDQSLMESAAETPRASFDGEYPHGDTFEMAAAYWYHIVQNHP